MSHMLDAALDLGERLLERGVLIVLQVRRTPTGKRISLGVGVLDAADAVLFAAAASRMLRRRRYVSPTATRTVERGDGAIPRYRAGLVFSSPPRRGSHPDAHVEPLRARPRREDGYNRNFIEVGSGARRVACRGAKKRARHRISLYVDGALRPGTKRLTARTSTVAGVSNRGRAKRTQFSEMLDLGNELPLNVFWSLVRLLNRSKSPLFVTLLSISV